MLERVRPVPVPAPAPAPSPAPAPAHARARYALVSVHKAISLLDKLYDTFFKPLRKANVRVFSKHYIKIEFLDKLCRPVFKEFDEWPMISLEPNIVKDKRDPIENTPGNIKQNYIVADLKMTRKSRPRIKEKEEKEPKGGYCEMCNTDYADAVLHRRSPHHLAFVRDHTNFLALDNLIGSGADVATFLDKATTINGERRSLRKMCNGDIEPPKNRRSKRSQSPDSTVNDSPSPKRNGGLEEEKKHNTRCSKKGNESQTSEDRQYYKVVTSTKLRSSGGFTAKRKDSPLTCNGTKPLVVKFRKVRRSELSVLSDEAEQFMFPKRASSTSSTSSDEEDEKEVVNTRERRTRVSKSPQQPSPSLERRRLARPLALKEESSEEDSWPEDKRKRRRKAPAVIKRTRKVPTKQTVVETPPLVTTEPVEPPLPPAGEAEVSPLREEASEKCMKWEDGKLKYTPAVEQLEFAFESVPHSEPWFETFKRQDQDKIVVKNVPQFFELYSTKLPKLPYEIGHLPPLKPNCCPLSDLVRRDDKPGPSRSYGTRGMKRQRNRKRIAAILSLEGHPRKSPREHASTLAILGSAGLLNRRKNIEDTKSTASEDTVSDTHSNTKVEAVLSETQEASERLQQFLSEVFEDAADYYVSDEVMDGEPAVTTSTTVPDVLSLVSECEDCDIIRNEIKACSVERKSRRGKFKKKNRTGWPNKKKQIKKGSRANSTDIDKSIERSSTEPPDDETTQDTISEEDANLSETENDRTLVEDKTKSLDDSLMDIDSSESKSSEEKIILRSDDKPLNLDVKVVLQDKIKDDKVSPKNDIVKVEKHQRSSTSETDECEDKGKKKRRSAVQGLGDWLQPVVRVPRVDANAVRRLRSAGRSRSSRLR